MDPLIQQVELYGRMDPLIQETEVHFSLVGKRRERRSVPCLPPDLQTRLNERFLVNSKTDSVESSQNVKANR